MKPNRGRPNQQELIVTEEHRSELRRLAAQECNSRRAAFRAQIILSCASGLSNSAVAARLQTTSFTVHFWRKQFIAKGIVGLGDVPRPGRPRKITDEQIAHVLRLTLETKPQEACYWSSGLLATKTGLSQSTISRIWRLYGLKPHLGERFSQRNDLLVNEELQDVVGIYMKPPHHVLVFCVEKKPQTQLLCQEQLVPPQTSWLMPNPNAYAEADISNLLISLDVATGQALGEYRPRHRAVEFLNFLKQIDSAVSADLDLHMILDNHNTYKAATIRQWLEKRPRYHLHFAPTHASWLDQVGRWISPLMQKHVALRKCYGIAKLKGAVDGFMLAHNRQPTPFIWLR